ncbi:MULTISPECIES: hypothetical protein [Pantoea]|jgi:hypothetical protein|uniref:Uncharacterized protein n=1 Tax=Pantoea brenneri TaxID=472694 RepID=A0A7Y6NH30_9GAMM|nr:MULTISPECIES: hypothetical protein [Pantoea]MBZ6397028.1 hypothetical protein [Pantoea sp.]MBZ6440221.1 hypothetical protein [Pantoea sp.]NUY43417.1 hypothetical protein [Pantoea brenneri]NUY51017.1 hypothetical protein [Pantoea brenneri]NUY61252.1 hypothetical protein [Pantoea brenneri]
MKAGEIYMLMRGSDELVGANVNVMRAVYGLWLNAPWRTKESCDTLTLGSVAQAIYGL